MLHSAVTYHVQFGKQKLGEDGEVELVNQIDASFPSPGCPVSVSNVTPNSKYAITEGKENIAPISSNNRGKQGSEGSKLKTPYRDRANSAGKIKRKLLNLKGRTCKNQVHCH